MRPQCRLSQPQSDQTCVWSGRELPQGQREALSPCWMTIDACMTGGALHSLLPPRITWLLGCTETQSTSGQTDNPRVPHGFVVLAACEALRGDADADNDGIVTVGELCAWTPGRATHLARFWCIQDGIVVLPEALAKVDEAEVNGIPAIRTPPCRQAPDQNGLVNAWDPSLSKSQPRSGTPVQGLPPNGMRRSVEFS